MRQLQESVGREQKKPRAFSAYPLAVASVACDGGNGLTGQNGLYASVDLHEQLLGLKGAAGEGVFGAVEQAESAGGSDPKLAVGGQVKGPDARAREASVAHSRS